MAKCAMRILLLLVFSVQLSWAPLVTGVWESLSEVDFNETNHFRGTELMIDPLTGQTTGQTARQAIAALAATHGWPLVGLFISAGGGIPHFVLHRSQFPQQTGAQGQRAEKLQTALDAALDRLYKLGTITDPTDPDFGKEVRTFWATTHVWNYRSDSSLYTPRIAGAGDFALRVSDASPSVNWWFERN